MKKLLRKFSKNSLKDKDITAIIPAKKESVRCKRKNIREFSDTNLLVLKIKILKQVKGIKEIIVSSNCDKALKIAEDLGVQAHRREERYCTDCPGSELYKCLAEIVETDLMLVANCVVPFVKKETYEEIIKLYREIENDSVATVHNLKEFIWHNNKPVNYDYGAHSASQNLPDYYILTFGVNLIDKYTVLKNKNVVGNTPYFYEVGQVESVDIDTSYDFLLAELLHKENIVNDYIANYIISRRKKYSGLELLDCTIREGGYRNNWNFSDEEVLDCYKAVSKSAYDYFEIGFRSSLDDINKKGKWYYCLDKDIDDIVNQFQGCKISVMADISKVTLNDFQEKKNSKIDLIRLMIEKVDDSGYSEDFITKAKATYQGLVDLGYDLCLNISCFDIREEEIELIVKHFHKSQLKAIYLTDFYGNVKDFILILHKFYLELGKHNSEIKIGVHLNSLEQVRKAIFHGCNMIDTCIAGIGRGLRNLESELLALELKQYNKKLDFISLVEFGEKYLRKVNGNNFYYLLAGSISLHPNFILDIINDYSYLSVKEKINLIYKLNDYMAKNRCKKYDKGLIKAVLQN